MGVYGNIVKIEEMRRKMQENDSLSALHILDKMNIVKIKNVSDLNLIAEVYNQNARYEEAKELLIKIYEKTKTRKTLFQLVEVSINSGHEEDAESYLSQYREISPNDFYNYIFRYQIDKMKGEPYKKLIETLEKLKKEEYIEKWCYELAKLYYKAGMDKECVKECEDIVLWFGEGTYVEKAKMLKSYFSGDKDKDKIIEELKQRASISSNEYVVDMDQITTVLKQDIQNVMMEDNNSENKEDTDKLKSLSLEFGIDLDEIFSGLLPKEEDKSILADNLKILLNENLENLQLVICGVTESDKTAIAKGIALVLKKVGKLKSSKIARIDANKLNTIHILDKKETLRDCCMIIENADNLDKSAIDQIQELIKSLTGNIAVIYEKNEEDDFNLSIGFPEQ